MAKGFRKLLMMCGAAGAAAAGAYYYAKQRDKARTNCFDDYFDDSDNSDGFNEADEEILPLYHILFRNRKQRGKNDVVGFPGVLEALEDSERHKKGSAEHGITRDEKHQPESDEQK